MNRRALVQAISARLGDSQLVWFGTRGDDVEAASEIPQLTAAYSVIAAYRGRSSVQAMALEDLTCVRPDLDTFEIDHDPRSAAMLALRRDLLRVLARPSHLFTYRPSTFVSAVCFARRDRCRYLGMFKDHQAAFEHKPWVESAIADMGLPHIPWRYVADDDQLDSVEFLREGSVMLRRSRTTGGVGLVRADDANQIKALWPQEDEAYVSVAPFIEGGLPVNVGGVVWHDGVTVHHASVQLIGIDGCTQRPFGFCGNDFAAVESIEPEVLDAIDSASTRIGHWLRSLGYRGAFGVDFLVVDGVPLFTEINPRFQGSTHASCRLSVEQDESCLLIEHLAAHLDLDAPGARSLREQAAAASPLAHLVVHWGGERGTVDPEPLLAGIVGAIPGARTDVTSRPAIVSETGATVARATVRERITTTGFDLVPPLRGAIDDWAAKIE